MKKVKEIKYLLKGISIVILALTLIGGFLYFCPKEWAQVKNKETNETFFSEFPATESSKQELIDVPLENQNTGEIPLENGCEITALSMLLNYYGYKTNKNELAELLNYVPVYENETEGIRGNPHEGFVGNIYEGLDAMGVAVEPIAEVAEKVIDDSHEVVASTTTSFDDLAQIVNEGEPVWVVTTVDFEVPTTEDFKIWQTNDGEVTVSPLCHAVVITGVDQAKVYVNDPHGYKNESVDRERFEKIYKAMGSQSLYLA
ncbi:family C39 peptidase [Enterococcus pseudoavium]|nr:family C39 peptidase [Enterococcus pseudoavium]